MVEKPLKMCQFCTAEISEKARKCSHCAEWLSRKDRTINNLIAPVIIGLFVGALLFYLGQSAERKNQTIRNLIEKQQQNDRMIKFLKIELSDNFANLNNIEKLLKKDLELLKSNQMTILPLCSFSFEAWERVQFGNADFLIDADTKDFMKLTNLYFILKIIDAQVKNRENYRLENEGKQGFVERMESLDGRILKSIETVRPVMEQAQEYLDKIHKWKMKGESFYIDENFVVNIIK